VHMGVDVFISTKSRTLLTVSSQPMLPLICRPNVVEI
jgi:hypothetical protein